MSSTPRSNSSLVKKSSKGGGKGKKKVKKTKKVAEPSVGIVVESPKRVNSKGWTIARNLIVHGKVGVIFC